MGPKIIWIYNAVQRPMSGRLGPHPEALLGGDGIFQEVGPSERMVSHCSMSLKGILGLQSFLVSHTTHHQVNRPLLPQDLAMIYCEATGLK
jgi:hypothetical protein